MSHRLFAVAAVTVLALQGCAKPPPQQAVTTDTLSDGIAKTCTFTPVQPTAGSTVESTITMTNDGWCAFRASEKTGQAYVLGLVKQRPEHGAMLVRQWNGETRAEYTPTPSFVGTDTFTVAFRASDAPADALVKVAVTVTRGEGGPAGAAPAAEEEKPAPTTTRRRSTSRKK